VNAKILFSIIIITLDITIWATTASAHRGLHGLQSCLRCSDSLLCLLVLPLQQPVLPRIHVMVPRHQLVQSKWRERRGEGWGGVRQG
jgi:hypothetical protein